MSDKPIFLATHPRACSTAFERVFMTRKDIKCVHEPFADAWWYGPERLGPRFDNDEKARSDSNCAETTYRTIFDRLAEEGSEGKRLFIKDMANHLVPSEGASSSIAPSLARKERGVGTQASHPNDSLSAEDKHAQHTEIDNPTVVPTEMLSQFHFTFLIRHPRSSVPSYLRCMIPPLDDVTGFYGFLPSETGISELRKVFDYLRSVGQTGPRVASRQANGVTGSKTTEAEGAEGTVDICVVDADDLLDNPAGIIKAYCDSVGLKFDPDNLSWDTEEEHTKARVTFENWKGFHDDAIESRGLTARTHPRKIKSKEEEDEEWTKKFGLETARVIRKTVDANVEDFEYLKTFALKAGS